MAKPQTMTSKTNLDVPKNKQDADGSEIVDLTAKKTVVMTKRRRTIKRAKRCKCTLKSPICSSNAATQSLRVKKRKETTRMKTLKFIVIACIFAVATLAVAPNASAQISLLNSSSRALDTVTNTGTKSMTSVKIAGARSYVTVSTVNAALTGTLSAVARLYGSLDGVNYQRIRTFQLHNLQVDSLVVDAAHTKYAWVVDGNPFQYYQVQTTGIGSVTFTVAGKYVTQATK